MINAINATKRISGIVRRAIKAMGWSIVAYPKVLALVGVLGNTRKGFILKLLVLQLAYGALAPYSLTHTATIFTVA
jgi:hypothetical protein